MNSFHAGAQSSRHATARLAVRCAGASFAGADLPGRAAALVASHPGDRRHLGLAECQRDGSDEAVAIAMAVATPHG